MNHQESVALCRFVKAACPQQAFDEFTADAWGDLLSDLRFVDCKDAARTITQRQPFCSPSEIRAEVRRIRADRVKAAEHLVSPPSDCDDYQAWLIDMRRRAGDGELEPETLELTPRDMALIEHALRPMPKPEVVAPVSALDEMRRGVIGKGPAREPDLPVVDHRQLARDAIDAETDQTVERRTYAEVNLPTEESEHA